MINKKPEIHNLVICSNVFIRKDGKYLLMKRSIDKIAAPGKIHPFGGKLDQDENPYRGAIREVKEETGIDIKNLKLEAVVFEIINEKDSPVNWLIFYFSADYDKGEIIETEEGEVVLLTKEQIKSSDLLPSVKNIIVNILNPNDGTVFTTNSYKGFEKDIEEISKNICVVK